jgi:hypothetical protein
MNRSSIARRQQGGTTIRLVVLALALALGLVLVPTASAIRFTDDSYLVPEGAVGEYYAHEFTGDGGCGPALPYQFRVLSGALPPGLSLTGDGLLVGIPTQAGSWSFWLELSRGASRGSPSVSSPSTSSLPSRSRPRRWHPRRWRHRTRFG